MEDAIKTSAEAVEADALPRLHEVHTDPNRKCVDAKPLKKNIAKKPVKQKSPAEWAYERIILYIKNDSLLCVLLYFIKYNFNTLYIQ